MEALSRGHGAPFLYWWALPITSLHPGPEEPVFVADPGTTFSKGGSRESRGAFLVDILPSPPLPALGRLCSVPNPSLQCQPHLRPWLEVCRCYLGHELTHRHDISPCWAGKWFESQRSPGAGTFHSCPRAGLWEDEDLHSTCPGERGCCGCRARHSGEAETKHWEHIR